MRSLLLLWERLCGGCDTHSAYDVPYENYHYLFVLVFFRECASYSPLSSSPTAC